MSAHSGWLWIAMVNVHLDALENSSRHDECSRINLQHGKQTPQLAGLKGRPDSERFGPAGSAHPSTPSAEWVREIQHRLFESIDPLLVRNRPLNAACTIVC
jgi:hypothetical protein